MVSDQDTILRWKMEPLSPLGASTSLTIDEDWIIFNDVDEPDTNAEISTKRLTKAEIAAKLLEELDSWTVKEEPLPDWLEEKIDLPIFEDIAPESTTLPYPSNDAGCSQRKLSSQLSAARIHHAQQLPSPEPHIDSTQTLLQEFENVLGDVEACHQVTNSGTILTLTPPQSPPSVSRILVALQPINQFSQNVELLPQQEEQINYLYEQHRRQQPQQQTIEIFHQQQQDVNEYQIVQQISPELIQLQDQWSAENLSVAPLLLPGSPEGSDASIDVQKEIADVDEYVRSCVENVAPSSPFASSSETGSYEDSSEDPDWCIATDSKSGKSKTTLLGGSRAERKPRLYGRPSPEDKRVRKKEQNKNAATRYRMKKKQEIKEILTEEQELVLKNEDLTTKVNDLQREIGYLKNLMRDLCKAKGLIK